MPKYDYAMYTTADRENDAADWYDTCEEAVAAAQKAIVAGADADGATWSEDWTAREEMGFVQ